MTSITCRRFIEFLDEYLDGVQPAPVRDAFERHLRECPACADYLRTYRASVALGKAAFADADAPVPASVPVELVQAVLTAAHVAMRGDESPSSDLAG